MTKKEALSSSCEEEETSWIIFIRRQFAHGGQSLVQSLLTFMPRPSLQNSEKI